MGKEDVIIDVHAPNEVRLPGERWARFWTSFVHLSRNVVDHGLETPAQRATTGKASTSHVMLSARTEASAFVIEIADDGRGVAWERVRERALDKGLPHATEADLVDALFADGVTTSDDVTPISGRGLGLGAVREAALALGACISVTSDPGRGTTFLFRFPLLQTRFDSDLVGSVAIPADREHRSGHQSDRA